MTGKSITRRTNLLVAAAFAIAALSLVACTAKTGGGAGEGTAPSSTTVDSSSPTVTASIPGNIPATVASSASTTYDLKAQGAADGTEDCASVAYGQVAAYLPANGCEALTRALFTTTASGHRVLVSAAQIIFVNPSSTQPFITLVTGNGSGDVHNLVDSGSATGSGLPAKFAGDPTFLAQVGGSPGEVDVFEAMWLDGPATHADDPTLASILKQSGANAFPSPVNIETCPSIGTLSIAMTTAHVNATLSQPPTCSGGWAVAFPSSNGNEFTVVFLSVAGTWRVVNRTVPCTANQIPAAIQQAACNSN